LWNITFEIIKYYRMCLMSSLTDIYGNDPPFLILMVYLLLHKYSIYYSLKYIKPPNWFFIWYISCPLCWYPFKIYESSNIIYFANNHVQFSTKLIYRISNLILFYKYCIDLIYISHTKCFNVKLCYCLYTGTNRKQE